MTLFPKTRVHILSFVDSSLEPLASADKREAAALIAAQKRAAVNHQLGCICPSCDPEGDYR